MAKSREWLNPNMVEALERISKTEGLHPSVHAICSAITNLSLVRPTSLTQQSHLVNAYFFLIRAVNLISTYGGEYNHFEIPDPRDMFFEKKAEEPEATPEEGKVLQLCGKKEI